MLLQIHPVNPKPSHVQQVIKELEAGGVIIYPTDTVYGLGCDIQSQKGMERICRIRQIKPEKAMLTLICHDISQIAEYAWQLDKGIFKLLKRNTPGPFTFILRSSLMVPKLFRNRKRTIGVRIPENLIALAIVEALGRPLLSVSLKPLPHSEMEENEYLTDPHDIHDDFQNLVDIVIDGGEGGAEPSTLVDCTTGELEVLREGKGQLDY